MAPIVSAPTDIVSVPRVRALLKSMFVAAAIVMVSIERVPAPAFVLHIVGWLPALTVSVAVFTIKF